MAITLEATYSKKLGLPNYSSHCFVVSLRTELTDLSQVEAESARLYTLLQQSVDTQVQDVGFLPDATTYGMADHGRRQPAHVNGNGANGHAPAHRNGSKPADAAPVDHEEDEASDTEAPAAWICSDKQRELIQKLAKQAKMKWDEVEHVARLRFDLGVAALDRKQASILIEALIARREDRLHERTSGNGGRARR